MTAPATTLPVEATQEQNREAKARLIARHAWRLGLTIEQLAVMPYSGEARSLTRFARAAYRESPDPADHDRNPPSSLQSRTWRLVTEKLTQMGALEAAALPVPARDLTHERHAWLPDEATEPVPALPAPSGEATPLAAPTLPRGWAELAALPLLDYGSCINHPSRRPVVISPDGGRCPDCPPRPGEIHVKFVPTREQLAQDLAPFEGYRDGWGMTLNWAPKTHIPAPLRCYCGRCPLEGQ